MALEKHFLPATVEARQYALWEASGLFKGHLEGSAPTYTVMMPPPNVTGHLHIGHALNYSLQDLLVRYHRMKGYRVLWQPGTDHAGIATQMVVERQLKIKGLSRQDMGRKAFLDHVWDFKENAGHAIVTQQRRLGLTPDWDRSRFTLDTGLSKAVRQVFIQFYKEGLIYRDKRLVNWDVQLQTAVSDLEVKSVNAKGHYWYIKYALEKDPQAHIIIATSRPETLFGDMAIAVHPDDARYSHLVGQKVRVPLTDRVIPIIADTYSDPTKGTGAVKITPGHDFNDFEVGQRHHLNNLSVMNETGHLNEQVPSAYRGLERYVARKKIIEDLKSLNYLDKIEEIDLVLPCSEKSDAILEPFLTDQWFVDAKKLADPALKAVETEAIRLYPQHWKNTYDHWLHTIQPWCISRQLWWGHEIPAWYGPDDTIFVAENETEAHKEATQHYGHAVTLRPETDVLDTWFSSALWPFSTLGWPDETQDYKTFYPTQVLITGTDILFFWVARMIMMGLKLTGQNPFQHVFLHALVRDEKGKKMSKTVGNVLDPLQIIDSHGTDALRLSLISLTVPGRDIKFSLDHVETKRHFVTKLWNAARFALYYDCVYDPGFDPVCLTSTLNRWIIMELGACSEALEKALKDYRFDEATRIVDQFTRGIFCDWYLELAKSFLINHDKEETQKTVAYVLVQLCHILNPFIPFVTEEIWCHFRPHSCLLMGQKWPVMTFSDFKAKDELTWVMDVIEKVRALRVIFNIPPKEPLHMAIEEGDDLAHKAFNAYQEVIKRLLNLETLTWGVPNTALFQKMCVKEMTPNAVLRIPLSHFLKGDEEIKRLNSLKESTLKEKNDFEKKLNNRAFMEKAPHDVIHTIKERHSNAINTINQLTSALTALKDNI